MKRIIALLLALGTLFMFAACGNGDEEGQSTTKPNLSNSTSDGANPGETSPDNTIEPGEPGTGAVTPGTTAVIGGSDTTTVRTQSNQNGKTTGRQPIATTKRPNSGVTTTTKWYDTVVTTTAAPVSGLTSAVKKKLGYDKKTIGDMLYSPITNDKYKLAFIDDFTGTTLNLNNWSYFTRNYNAAEESVNRKENVAVQNGSLVITGKKENQKYTGSAESWETPKTSYFTGGAINSQGKKEFKYGRLEILCKIPYSYGMWPAFWTMGTQRGWPWGGEIDIMEFVGGTDRWNNYRDDEYNCGLHWADPNTPSNEAWGGSGHLTRGFANPSKFEIPDGPSKGAKLNDEWHVCGLEWNNKTMTTYCDGNVIGTIDITDPPMREAFHQTHYIILNLVMGGSWAGTPNEKTVFPQKFMVDWVKVWQR